MTDKTWTCKCGEINKVPDVADAYYNQTIYSKCLECGQLVGFRGGVLKIYYDQESKVNQEPAGKYIWGIGQNPDWQGREDNSSTINRKRLSQLRRELGLQMLNLNVRLRKSECGLKRREMFRQYNCLMRLRAIADGLPIAEKVKVKGADISKIDLPNDYLKALKYEKNHK